MELSEQQPQEIQQPGDDKLQLEDKCTKFKKDLAETREKLRNAETKIRDLQQLLKDYEAEQLRLQLQKKTMKKNKKSCS